jgi:endoglucanase
LASTLSFIFIEASMRNTLLYSLLLTSTVLANVVYYGVNECGYEFGPIPGTYGVDYEIPSNSSVDYFLGKGMNTIRFPFMWERVQKTLNGNLDTVELRRMDSFISYVTGKGAFLVLDPHNSARYNGQIIGGNRLLLF